MRRIPVHQRQRFSDLRIAGAGQPTCLVGWKVRNVGPKSFYEQYL